jgi:hypothetical protein
MTNEEITYTAFVITDIKTGKPCFVGMTGRPVEVISQEIQRKRRVRPLLAAAIKKAPNKYRIEVIETGISRDNRKRRRLALIKEKKTFEPYGFNKLGGTG